MKRLLFNLLAATSLLLSVAAAALWVRSQTAIDSLVWSNSTELPLTAADKAYAAQQHYAANFVAHSFSHTLFSRRGSIGYSYVSYDSVMTRWDETFQKQHVNRPNLQHVSEPVGMNPSPFHGLWGHLGFIREDTRRPESPRYSALHARTIALPLWLAILLLALMPVYGWRRRRRISLLRRRHHCRNCGYDLRATPDRCPECGTVPKTTA